MKLLNNLSCGIITATTGLAKNKIIIHPALTITDEVNIASDIFNGIDTGKIICLGPFLKITGNKNNDEDIIKHEQLQKQISDKPALTMAMNLFFKSDFQQLGNLHKDKQND